MITLLDLLRELGLNVSEEKLVPPTYKAICLGIEINTQEHTISIPAGKFKEIQILCAIWA